MGMGIGNGNGNGNGVIGGNQNRNRSRRIGMMEGRMEEDFNEKSKSKWKCKSHIIYHQKDDGMPS